jgi:succinate dehydrogenase/fumarate reductase cytochrome b subunit (b558 family)
MRSTLVPNPDPTHRPVASRLVRRLFSLSGVLPLGAFLLLHLAVNVRALRGETAFARAVDAIHRVPVIAALEWLLVLAPLLLHASVGLWLVATRQTLAEDGHYPGPLRIAVRATGVAAVVFLAMHLPELRFHRASPRLDGAELATVLAEDLSSVWYGVPWRGAAYLVGTACVTFHFAAGLWAFAVTTRVGKGERARKWAGWAAAAFGAAVWMLLADVVVFHATGARLLGTAEEPGSHVPCPARE